MRALSMLLGMIFLLALGDRPAMAATEDTGALVDRITWGRTPQTVAEAEQLGSRRWLAQQLHPDPTASLPAAIQAQIDAMRITREAPEEIAAAIRAQGKAAQKVQNPSERLVAQQAYQKSLAELKHEAITRSLLRAVYSPNQLQEQMTWFWFNHFNVAAEKHEIRVMVGDFEDSAIRPRALGQFRDLLKAVAVHPAMLRYLDNDKNALGRINENYAREILELHTLGVGSGYSQKDVEEMARVLTGFGVSFAPEPPVLKPDHRALYVRVGLMEFNPDNHDFGDKVVLGHRILGAGLPELEQVLDILSRQPATAQHISRDLALYFMDAAPQSVVDRMAQTFLNKDGDIAEVLAVLFASREFKASLGRKIKDPVHYVVSAVRLAYDGQIITNPAPLKTWTDTLGQGVYGRDTPDGYPLENTAWSGPGQLATLFDVAQQIGANSPSLFRKSESAAGIRRLPQLQISTLGGRHWPLSAQTRAVLVQTRTPIEWNALFLSSPEFLFR